MRKLLKRLITLSLVFLPLIAYAQSPSDMTDVFAVSPTDPSVIFLGQIFGTVGGSLHGTSGQLMGTLFKYFNLGILAVAGIFLVFTTVKLVLETTAQGSFMGREGKAAFTVIRTVTGIGLLVPSSTTGYSVIQVIVMWAVVQGTGFANTLWNKALDYFASGGQVFVTPPVDLTNVVTIAGSVMECQVCMYYFEKKYNAQKQAAQARVNAGTATVLDQQLAKQFVPTFSPYINAAAATVNFPSSLGNNPADNGCGTIYWGQGNPNNNAIVGNALMDVIDTNASAARRIVNPYSNDLQVVDPATGATRLQQTVSTALVASASDWTNLLIPLRAQAQDPSQLKNFMADARKSGWILAGSYYYSLAKIQRNMQLASAIDVKLPKAPMCLTNNGGYFAFPSLGIPNPCTDSNPGLAAAYTLAANYVVTARSLAQDVSNAASQTVTFSLDVGALVGIAILLPFILPLAIGLPICVNTMSGTGDPIMKLQSMGNTLMETVMACWIIGSLIMFVLSVVASLMSSEFSFGFAFRDAMSVVLPLLMGLLAVLFVQGSVIAVYIPLIPFIVFSFSVLGWFIVVIEAMAAAPLVALGVTHPEGHDWMGKSEQAIMLMLSVFLRPALMILGLLAAMLLSNIMMQVINFGFAIAMGGSSMSLLAFIATFTIYIVLIMQIVTQSYALIYLVPDRVMKWIGTGVEAPSGAAAALGAAEKAHGEMSGVGAKMGGMVEGFKGTGKAVGGKGKAAIEKGKAQKTTGGSESPGSGGGAGGGGGPGIKPK